jgi:hypothetical protein
MILPVQIFFERFILATAFFVFEKLISNDIQYCIHRYAINEESCLFAYLFGNAQNLVKSNA